MFREARSVIAQLGRSPAYVLLSVLVLGLGLGAATATFVVLESVILHPLPFPDADRLAILWKTSSQFGDSISINPDPEEAERWRESATRFESIEIEKSRSMLHRPQEGPTEAWSTLHVSPDFLRFLGVEPAAGRMFGEGDAGVALIDYRRYRRDFGGDPSVLGSTVTLDGETVTIVGVLPRRFRRPSGFAGRVDAILPLSADDARGNVVARLKPGVEIAEAERELDFLLAQASSDEESAAANPMAAAEWKSRVQHPGDMTGGRTAEILWTLMAAMLVVLLLACTNVASLFLTRGLARRRMLAIRHALGASRAELVRPLVLEAAAIGALATLVAWWIAVSELALVRRFRPDSLEYLDAIGTTGRVPGFVFLITLLALTLYGILPALRVVATVDTDDLRQGGSSGDPSSQRLRSLLVATQVALSFVLLASGLLLFDHLRELRDVDLGYRPEGVVAARVQLPDWRLEDAEAVAASQLRLVDGLREWPVDSPARPSRQCTHSVRRRGR